MKVSIVVSTFNRRELVLRAVKTLFDQQFPSREFEIIVVVDGSRDGSADSLRALRPTVAYQVIEQPNRGLAEARNTGWHEAEGDIVVFLDDDMLCAPSLVRGHWEAHAVHSNAIGVGAVVLDPESPRTVAAECFNREVGAYAQNKTANLAALPLSACIFGNASLPRKCLQESGGFDGRYRMREDAEFAVRLNRIGVRPIFVKDARARQIYMKTPADLIRDAEAFAEADAFFLQQHPEAADLTFAGRIAREPAWKRSIRRILAAVPVLSDLMAALLEGLAQSFSKQPWLLALGVRALQMRRGIHYFRRLREMKLHNLP